MTTQINRRNLIAAVAALGTLGFVTTASAGHEIEEDPCDDHTAYDVEPTVEPIGYGQTYGEPTYGEPTYGQNNGRYRWGRSSRLIGSLSSQEYELLGRVGSLLDRDGDGRLDPAERRNFETLILTMRLFDRADRNSSSRLNPEEAGRSRFFAGRFAHLDRDRDGHVLKPELVRAVLMSIRRGDRYFDDARLTRTDERYDRYRDGRYRDVRDGRTSWLGAGFEGGLYVSAQ